MVLPNMFTTLNTMVLLQKEAERRLAGKPSVIAAAKIGNSSLIVDHFLSNSAAVHEKDNRYSDST
jgi:hypothetical protein